MKPNGHCMILFVSLGISSRIIELSMVVVQLKSLVHSLSPTPLTRSAFSISYLTVRLLESNNML
jgi:hypothetical protein